MTRPPRPNLSDAPEWVRGLFDRLDWQLEYLADAQLRASQAAKLALARCDELELRVRRLEEIAAE